MSKCYHIQCEDCKKTLWIGQTGENKKYIYTGEKETMSALTNFLFNHENHKLKFVNDEKIEDDYEDLSDYD